MQNEQISKQIESLIVQLHCLRTRFHESVNAGRTFEEVKSIYLQMKELNSAINDLQQKEEGSFIFRQAQPAGNTTIQA